VVWRARYFFIGGIAIFIAVGLFGWHVCGGEHWAGVYANKDFVEGFASKFRPLLMTQEVKLLHPAPWGPHP
jgi:hypothetical protein